MTEIRLTIGQSAVNIIFQIVNLILGIIVFIIGAFSLGWAQYIANNPDIGAIKLFTPWSVNSIVIGVYVMFFGLLIVFVSFWVPPPIYRWFGFLFHWLGRGFFFLFVGFIVLTNAFLNIVVGIIIIILGIIYIILGILSFFHVVGMPVPLLGMISKRADAAQANTV